ncbi:retinol dehydrogenase 7-like [Anolis sagrei]|uniref:retinol dehydrogenase 7-like n=1 Tax=Anolis sagrei TaxID=38937 RepID=UPI00351FD764
MWLYLAVLVGFYFFCRWYRERQTVDKLTEKYVFITGCDSGFGNQLARQLDTQGMRVLAACLTQKGAEELDRISSERLKTIILDITKTESVEAATEWVREQVEGKELWGLVNNAGIVSPMAPNEWLTKDDFMKVLEVNLLGTIDVTLHMLPLVRKAQGRVVNVTSTAGRIAFSGGGYSPSKFALEAFSDSLRRELHPFGVKVSIIEPGAFNTGIGDIIVENSRILWSRLPDEVKKIYGEKYIEEFLKSFTQYKYGVSSNLYPVTDAMEHALTSCYPRSRYAVGWDAKCVFIPLTYLPASLGDYVTTLHLPKPSGTLY